MYSPSSFNMKPLLNVTLGDTNHNLPSNVLTSNSLKVEKFTLVRVKTSGDM